jgi:hypothetical protein
MGFWDILKKPAADAVSTILGSATNLIDEVVTNKEEREKLKLELLKQQQDFELKVMEASNKNEEAYLADVANARDMQKAALSQDDIFSKRFVYYLASFWSISGIAYIFTATYAKVQNERVVDTVLGFLLGTIVATIINYFFGSSKGSSDKHALLEAITNKDTK